jgi:hypothetical protein
MAKKIKVIVAQGVKHLGKYPPIGHQIELDESEAKRLLESGAVTLAVAGAVNTEAPPPPPPAKNNKGGKATDVPPPPPPSTEEADLINRIAEAETTEALLAIIPQEKPSDAVIAAADKRQAELDAAGK